MDLIKNLINLFESESISAEDKKDAFEVFKDWSFQRRVNLGFTPIERVFNTAWQNGKLETVDLSKLTPHHDWGRRTESKNPAIVARLKNGEFVILDGQHRVITAKELGKTQINCFVLDMPIRYSKPTKKYLLDES